MRSRRRKLQIDLDDETGTRLDTLAANSTRYRHAGDVGSEIVRLYVGFLEDLETHMTNFKRRQRQRAAEPRTTKPAPRTRAGN